MSALADQDRAPDARASPRTNLFLAAVLYGNGFSAPVKIRNLSSTGAFVEGAAMPDIGAAVRLVRGSLAIPGHVVWSSGGRCGLHFSSLVSVREWLAPGSREQQRVDDAVRLLKSGAIPLTPVACGEHGLGSAQLGSDLKTVVRLLESLADHLGANQAILLAHGDELQNLDIAVQTLNAVAGALSGNRDEEAIGARIGSLRASCRHALARGG